MGSDTFSVLVVCTGNLNRSALGAALLDTWAGWYLPPGIASNVQVTSAGLQAPVGSKMRSRTRRIAEALGADRAASHRARQITEEMIRSADLVLVAERQQRESVLGMVPSALRSTFTIREAGRIVEQLPEWPAPAPASVGELRARVAMVAENRNVAAGAVGAADDDIIDPQGKDDDAYRVMARQEVPALAHLAAALFGMPAREVAAYDDAVTDAAALGFGDPEAESPAEHGRPRGRRQA